MVGYDGVRGGRESEGNDDEKQGLLSISILLHSYLLELLMIHKCVHRMSDLQLHIMISNKHGRQITNEIT